MANDIASWLTRGPKESILPIFDRTMLPLLKVGYVFIRILLRFSLGKGRRERSKLSKKRYVGDYTIPSYGLLKFFYKKRKETKPGKSRLLKVHVNDRGYKYYCRLEDFNPGREEDILELFRPKKGDTVVDIGAHIGNIRLLHLKWLDLKEK